MITAIQHMFTQMFFFSLTDNTGRPTLAVGENIQGRAVPVGLDFLGRLEHMEEDWAQVEEVSKNYFVNAFSMPFSSTFWC